MLKKCIPACILLAGLMGSVSFADELTKIIQNDLVTLGYDTGDTSGEMTTATIVAISKFQAKNDLEITGEPTPQLAGIIKAKLKGTSAPAAQPTAPAVASATAPSTADDAAALQAAQQACVQEKIAAAQASQKKKKGFGSLMRAVTNTATRYGGNNDLARQVSETSYDIYRADATADDWERAAEDLGLTQDELEACRNP